MEQQTQQTRRGRRARGDAVRRHGGRAVPQPRTEHTPSTAAAPGHRGDSPWAEPAATSPGRVTIAPGGCLGGYRLVRRLATGARAQLFLVTAEPAGEELDDHAAAERPLLLRVYDEAAEQQTVTAELEALETLGGGPLPAIADLFTAGSSICLVVELIPGRRLSNVLDERRLTPGEAVTVLAPIVAAVSELARAGFAHPALTAADVRFDAAGRPRITGLGRLQRLGAASAERTALERHAHEALVDLLELVAGAANPATALQQLVELARSRLAARPFEPFARSLEQELFRVAVAAPVRGVGEDHRATGIVPPPPSAIGAPGGWPNGAASVPPGAPSTPSGSIGRGRFRRGTRPQVSGAAPRAALSELLAAEVPVLELLRSGRWRGRLAERLVRRRGAVVVGALLSAATSVLLLTLVPPDRGDSVERAAESRPSAPEAPSSERLTPPDDAGPTDLEGETLAEGPSASDDGEALAATAAELLADRATCLAVADPECLAQLVQPGSALERSDLARIAGEQPVEQAPYDLDAVAVVGTMGGAVLLEVPISGAEREPASLLMIRSEAGWRLREIFD